MTPRRRCRERTTRRLVATAAPVLAMGVVLCCWTVAIGAADVSDDAAPQLVPVDGPPRPARLVSIDPGGRFVFESDSAEQAFSADELTEWGSPVEATRDALVVLADGGQFPADVLSTDGELLLVDSRLLGALRLPLESLAGVVFHPPSEVQRRDRLRERAFPELHADDEPLDTDRVILQNGDELAGDVMALDGGTLNIEGGLGAIAVEADSIGIVVFNPALRRAVDRKTPTVWVGLKDGSRFAAASVEGNPKRGVLVSLSDGTLFSPPFESIVYLRPTGRRVVYLSDLEPASYLHLPFLELEWPYRNDRNVVGTQLRAGGRLHVKGVGMHSTARLTYRLDEPYRRFEAEVAIDDETHGGGSVRFRVFVDGVERYRSETVRGGDAPRPVNVELDGARQLSLVVDFAERGDVLDHADWLDARLVK